MSTHFSATGHTYHIRPAAEADWPAVLAVNAEGVPGVSALDREELSDLAKEAGFFCVAESGREIVAYLLAFTPDARYEGEEFGWFRRNVPSALYVDQVAVSEAWRGRGVASVLYREAAAFARSCGLDHLVCEINLEPPNPVSLRFHQARGFQPVGMMQTSDGRHVSLQRCAVAPLLGIF